MRRGYHKSWQSDRPLKRYSRIAKWYQGRDGDLISIRIKFDDGYRSVNKFYSDAESATRDYEAFIAGTVTVKDLLAT